MLPPTAHATLRRALRFPIGINGVKGPPAGHGFAEESGVQQSTIARRVARRGTGLHCGEEVEVILCPAPAHSGIVFVSLGAGAPAVDIEIPALAAAVLSTARATTLGVQAGPAPAEASNGLSTDLSYARVATVEHLLASLFALGIDNIRVEVKGPEIPVMDGSASGFLELLRLAGRTELGVPRREIEVTRPFEIREGDRWIRIAPAEGLQIHYAIEFEHPCIGRQTIEIAALDEATFESQLAGARTFGFAHEVEALRKDGLAQGGAIENTLVLDETRVLNPEGPRWPDEYVRHKVVDLLGDLALLGTFLHAHVEVEKGGHRLHHQLVRALLDEPGLLRDRPTVSSTELPPLRVVSRAVASS
jgi:UDP-3-O-[3-hydroxymyristoyl] N-acetylglucosamine deacetylase